jgi:pantoate--beta-alanine ligase
MQGALVQRHIPQIRSQVQQWRAQGLSVGFVPTMGALHRGHATLILRAKEQCARVVVSIFVNPTQFGPSEDFAKYPRTFDKDYDVVTACGADMVFLPEVQEIYPAGHATQVQVQGLTDCLCGAARPGHFDGVALVVSMLLNIVRPDMSFFGEKDYQQLQVIKRLHQDLHLDGSIVAVPTVREGDGLALSSRNQYLSGEERKIAPVLFETLQWIGRNRTLHGVPYLVELGRERILAAGFSDIDYLEVRDGEHLLLQDHFTEDSRVFVAARLGSTRLIDNLAVRECLNS